MTDTGAESDVQTLYVYVTGADGAGKTSLVASLGNEDDFFIDEELAIEYRVYHVDIELDLCVLAPVDGMRFDPLLEIDPRDLLGYIVMVDSTDVPSWELTQKMIGTCRGYALLPIILAANKQDLPNAIQPDRVGTALGTDAMMRVLGSVATQPASAREVFLQLLYAIEREMEELDNLIARIEDLFGGD